MICYQMMEPLLNEKILPKAMVEGKSVLIIGGNDAFAGPKEHRQTGALRLQEYLLGQGAAACRLLGLFYELRPEGLDLLGDISGITTANVGSPELILVLSGMEKSADFGLAAAALRACLADGGHLLLLVRTPADNTAAYSVTDYEDRWRYEPADMAALFAGDTLELALASQQNRWLCLRLQKNADGTGLRPDARIYASRVGRKITAAESRSLGYFRDCQGLSALGTRWGTDKNYYGHNYLDKYEFLLRPLRDRAFTLLELGVFNGGSERMWQDYFPQAAIVGVDIDERCRQYVGPRIRIEIMDLGEKANLEALRALRPALIVDDASHIWSHQIQALFTLFPVLPSGGVYILEDMETSLSPDLFPGYDGGSPDDAYTICERIARVTASKRPDTGSRWAKEVTAIGLAAEMVVTIKGACVFIRR